MSGKLLQLEVWLFVLSTFTVTLSFLLLSLILLSKHEATATICLLQP